MERNWKGKWVKVVNRLTLLPPLGFAQEIRDGPFAGSKMFVVYSPERNRTRVDVHGEFQSSTIPLEDLREEALAYLDETFSEDASVIKALQHRA